MRAWGHEAEDEDGKLFRERERERGGWGHEPREKA